MREIVHLQAGQCGNQIGGKVSLQFCLVIEVVSEVARIQNGDSTLSTFFILDRRGYYRHVAVCAD